MTDTIQITAPQMTAIERELYEANHSEEYRGFVIKAKRDFGRYGYWSSEHRCNINAGWVATFGSGLYRGCQAMPGAVWAWTLAGTREMIDDYIAAGGSGEANGCDETADAALFHRLCRERNEAKRQAAPKPGVAELEAQARAKAPGRPEIEHPFTSHDRLLVAWRERWGEFEYRHNGVRIERARAVELIGEDA